MQHPGREARGFAIVGRGRRPNQLNTVFPFWKVSIHGQRRLNDYDTQVKLFVFAA